MKEVLEMSNKELERYRVIQKVAEGSLTQRKAAELLNLSDRQIRNLLILIKTEGAKGLISKKRGHPSNRRALASFRHHVLSIVRQKYEDFGPTLAREKLEEVHGIKLSKETLRKWMAESHIWVPKQRKIKTHPSRMRRECFGEMIQVDGSHEFWFENRGEKCVVIVFIDDASGKITSLYFCKEETLDGYYKALEKHLLRYGKPLSIYSDRFSVFDSPVEGNLTQFQRALRSLGIKPILANSPQAKGRVERANRTLQDRLIKEMRLLEINTIEAANEFADRFVEKYNKSFSKEPANTFDAHRPLEIEVDLSRILSRYEERTLTKDGVFQFHNRFYILMEDLKGTSPRGQRIELRVEKMGNVRAFLKDKEVVVKRLETIREKKAAENIKEIEWREKKTKRQSFNHPWKIKLYRQRTCELLKKVV